MIKFKHISGHEMAVDPRAVTAVVPRRIAGNQEEPETEIYVHGAGQIVVRETWLDVVERIMVAEAEEAEGKAARDAELSKLVSLLRGAAEKWIEANPPRAVGEADPDLFHQPPPDFQAPPPAEEPPPPRHPAHYPL